MLNDEVLPELAVPFGIKLSSLCPLSLLLEVSEVEVLSGWNGGGGGFGGSFSVVGMEEFLKSGGANQQGDLFLCEMDGGPSDHNGGGRGVGVGMHGEACSYVTREMVAENGAWGFLEPPISVMGGFSRFVSLPLLGSEAKEVVQAVLVAM